MAINFKSIELSDRRLVQSYLKESERRFCENTFGNLFCWSPVSGYKLAVFDDTLIVGNPERRRFDMPVGKNVQGAISELKKQFGEFTLSSISESECAMFTDFEITENTDYFDYIYESEKLRELKGKKLAAKRNHINAFMADGEWHTEKILPHHCKMLVDFNKKWCDGRCQDKYLQMEICAARRGLENFESLGFLGLMLYKNGALVAYSYGEPINRDTFCVHVEKADSEVRGAYQMINREFAREYCTDYKLINREDDAGDEGLRRAKLSYYPTQAGRKFRAIIK